MILEAPRRISQPADKNTVSGMYGKNNNARIKQPVSRNELINLNKITNNGSGSGQSAPQRTVQPQSMPQSAPVRTAPPQSTPPGPAVQNTVPPRTTAQNTVPPRTSAPNVVQSRPAQTSPNVVPSRPAQPQPSVNTPAAQPSVQQQPKRRRAPAGGTELQKGQKWSVSVNGQTPKALKICVGWECSDSRYELDASAFMLGENGKVPGEEWFIFYGQTASPDRSVIYRSNADNPNAPDDAELMVQPSKISPQVTKIAICVTIYEAFERRLNFGAVRDLYARVLDERNNEIGRFLLKECSSEVTAMVVGELYRYKNEWKFNAVGSGVNRDLAGFCGMYGIDLK